MEKLARAVLKFGAHPVTGTLCMVTWLAQSGAHCIGSGSEIVVPFYEVRLWAPAFGSGTCTRIAADPAGARKYGLGRNETYFPAFKSSSERLAFALSGGMSPVVV